MPNLNALRHGCCAVETILLPHEKQEDFESLTKEYQDTYENLGEFEQDLLHHAILYTETPSQSNWTDDQHTKLNRALRYKPSTPTTSEPT